MSLCIQKEISFSKTIYLNDGLNTATTSTTANAIMMMEFFSAVSCWHERETGWAISLSCCKEMNKPIIYNLSSIFVNMTLWKSSLFTTGL